MSGISRRHLMAGAAASGAFATLPRIASAQGSGVLFREVLLVDGTGAKARMADVLVAGDRIARILPPGAGQAGRTRVVAGEGRVLSPGFIDTHTHGDVLTDKFDKFLAMGATTVTLGMDGGGPRLKDKLDLRPWLEAADRAPLELNVATLSSHGTLRRTVGIGDGERRPDDVALARMGAQLDAELKAGAFGLSYGLEYVPGIYSELRELTSLGRVVSRHGAVVMSHMRTEDDDQIGKSIEELIASSLPGRPHVSHLKVTLGKGEARARALLELLAAKRRQGIAITADAYPYTASYTGIALLFPEWALPPTDYAGVVATRRAELRDHVEKRMIRRGGPEALLLGTGTYAGKTVAQAAKEAGLAYPDFLLKLGPTGASGAHFAQDQALQDVLIVDPYVAISTDGGPGMRHPRATGTYAKWIEDFVVTRKLLPIEEAVRKATSLPAQILRLADRGVVRQGARADLILFDPAKVKARSSYLDPFARAEGFDLVVVNGRPAYENGASVGTPGKLIRSEGTGAA